MPPRKEAILKAIDGARNSSKKRKFTQSFDLILNLRDIDLKKPENRINELVALPHSNTRDTKITVLATGDLALRARKAGANMVMGKEELEALRADKKGAKVLARNTDFFLAETSLMASVGRILGPVLGPRGKMPTPIPPPAPIDTLIERHKRMIRLRVRDQLKAQCRVGSEDMESGFIAENIQAVFTRLEEKLTKGLRNIKSAYVKTSMGPSVKIKI